MTSKINNESEERTSSTYALTMYRHNHTLNGKEIKIGKQVTKTFGIPLDKRLLIAYILPTTLALMSVFW
jgi:hypothetical protein